MVGFKKELVKRYQHCLISRAHCRESDGVHIIHRFICRELNRKDLIHNSFNGMLLFSGLHRSYDNYIWALDIFSLNTSVNSDQEKSSWCDLKIIASPEHKGYFINHYVGTSIRIPLKSIPYLWVDYQVFVDYNFHGVTGRRELTNTYHKYMSSQIFANLVKDPLGELSRLKLQRSDLSFRAAIQYDLHHDHYLVLGNRMAWSENRWVKATHITREMRETFHELREEKIDQDFSPPKKRKYSEKVESKEYELRKRVKID